MKPKALRLIFFLLILMAGYNSAYSQLIGTGGSNAGDCTWCICCECQSCAPISILPVMCATPGTTITVPITVGEVLGCNNFHDIGAVSLRINYDPNVLVFNTVTVPNAPTGWTLLAGTNPAGTLTISYYWDNVHNWDLGNGAHMFDISFNFLGGSSNLTFDDQNEACQFATYYNLTSNNGLILCQTAANYVDGFVAGPVVTLDPFQNVCVNAQPFALTGGSPAGGTYKVDNVVKTMFDPAAAGVGIHTITYCKSVTYHYGVNNSGTLTCENCATRTIEVYPLPQVGTGTYGPVCSNANDIPLTGGTPAGGTWSGDHVFPIAGAPGYFFDVSDAGVGSHVITYTYVNQNGCSNSANTTIVVNATPVLVITNPLAVCFPATVDLSAAAVTAGSTLYGAALSYWTNAGATTPLPNYTAVATSGTYYIKALTTAGCYDIKPVVVVVNPTPTCNITGPDPVCEGTTHTYSAPAGFSYVWSITGNGTIPNPSTGQTVDVTAGTAGSFALTVVVTNQYGCTCTSTKTVVVNALPVLTTGTLQSTTDLASWIPVPGQWPDFNMCINPLVEFYYIDLLTLTPSIPLADAMYPFKITPPAPGDPFWAYWNAKGVNAGATPGTWQYVMWQIINANQPMFYLKVTGTNYDLIDGLQYLIGGGSNPLRISGDYPQGTYAFTGTVNGLNTCTSLPVTINMTFNTFTCFINGPSPVCLGTTQVYTGPPQLPTLSIYDNPTYEWVILDEENSANASISGNADGPTVSVLIPSTGPATVQGNPVYVLPLGFTIQLTTHYSSGCITTCSMRVPCNVLPDAEVVPTDVTCNGASDGTVEFTPIAGTPPFIYTLNNVSSGPQDGAYTFTGLALGNYPWTMSDANTCINSGNVSIGQPGLLSATVVATNVTCNGACDGTITISSPAGGYGTYEFSINGGTTWASTMSYTQLCPGSYDVKIRDAAHTGCIIDLGTKVITQPGVLFATVVATNVTCNGSCDGTITISGPTGGYGTYEFSINGGNTWASTMSYTQLCPGSYDVKIRDAAHTGCLIDLGTKDITQPGLLSATVVATNVTCNGSCDGTITISNPAGGYGTYEFSINGGTTWASTMAYTQLCPGSYNVKIRDAAHTGCVIDLGTKVITQPGVMSATVVATNVTCNGSCDGTITISSPTGGYGTYEFSINGGTTWSSNMAYTQLCPGNYNVKIRDAAHTGCVIDLGTKVITQPGVLSATVAATNVTCNGSCNGTITISNPAGGYGTYEFSINGGTTWSATMAYTQLCPGTYAVMIRDAAHVACIKDLGSKVITQPDPLIVSPTNDSPKCVGQTLHLYGSATGGTSPYLSYHWTGPNGQSYWSINKEVTNVTILENGVWTLTVEDHNHCIASATTTVVINPLPPSGFTGDFTVCANSENLVYTGPAGQAAYHWVVSECGQIVGPDNQQTVTIKVFGPTAKCGGNNCTLCLTTTSQFGCTSQTCHDITIYPLPPCTISGDNTVGCGSTQQYQGPSGLSYAWSITGDGIITSATNIRTITVLAGAAGNSYTVFLTTTNSNGCSSTCDKIVTIHSHSICGHVEYNNCYQTKLVGVTVKLLGNNQLLATTTTDGQGDYTFGNLCDGTYQIVAESPNKPVGGINSTDAAQVNYWGSFPYNIEMVKFMSGDVTNNNWIASIDAQRIQRFFVFGDAFERPTWVYWKTGVIIHSNNNIPYGGIPTSITATINDGNATVDLLGMVTGDYNGSFNPGSKKSASATLQLVYDGNLQVTPGQEFDLPVSVLSQTEVGAVSLLLDIPTDLVEVKDVVMKGTGTPLNFTVNGNELRIGWNSTTPVNVAGGGDLIILKLKATERFVDGTSMKLTLAADELNELADGAFSVIPDATLMVDVVANGVIGIDEQNGANLSFLAFPNPFLDFTTITYTLPESGKVSVQIHDMLGNSVQTVVDETMVAGKYTKKVDFRGMPQGVYTATILFDNGKEKATRTIKLIVYK